MDLMFSLTRLVNPPNSPNVFFCLFDKQERKICFVAAIDKNALKTSYRKAGFVRLYNDMMKTPSRKQVIHNNSSYPKDENFIVPDLAEELCSPRLNYYISISCLKSFIYEEVINSSVTTATCVSWSLVNMFFKFIENLNQVIRILFCCTTSLTAFKFEFIYCIGGRTHRYFR